MQCKQLSLFILFFVFGYAVNSQNILYSEAFTDQLGKGAIGSTPSVDLSGVSWNIDFSDADLSNNYRFRVRNVNGDALFEGRNVGSSTWLSPVISIDTFTDISFTIAASQGGNNLENSDTMTTQYRINSDTWLTADTNGFLQNDYGSVTISQNGLNGSTLEIRVIMVNNRNNERHRIDNILVNGTAPCSEAENISNLAATGNNTSALLNWTNSTCFEEVIIIGKSGSVPNTVPVGDGSDYLPNGYFGAGLEIAPNEFIVYKGTGDTTTITNLINGSTYFFTAYTRFELDWSSGITVSVIPEITYCDSNSSSVEFEHITRVRLNTIDNAPGDNGATFYSDFTNLSTDLTKEDTYTVTINAFKSLPNDPLVFSVWIDYNADGNFDDVDELAFQQTAISDEVNGAFTVPISSVVGPTRMRVSMKFDTASDPCETTFFYGEVEDYSINLLGSVDYTYDLGWQPTNPNGISTQVDTITIINGEALFTENTKANNITINPTGAMRVDSGIVIDIDEDLLLESISDSYSSLISDGTILGTLTYERHVNEFNTTPGSVTGQNDLVAPPLTSEELTFNTFRNLPGNSVIPSGTINGVPSFLFGPFDRDLNAYINYNSSNENDLLLAGIGYRTASIVPGGSPLTFTGDIRKNIVSIPTSIGSGSEWNLVGNPYPSYLNSGDFLATNALILDADAVGIYGYDGTAQNGWTIINFNTMNTADNLAPGQGFMIAAKGSNDLLFTPGMRRNSGGDDFIPGRATSNNYHLRVLANTNDASYPTDFYFNDNSTQALDPGYDAKLYSSSLPNFYLYSQLLQSDVAKPLAIQSLNLEDMSNVIIPIGIKSSQGIPLQFNIEFSSLPDSIEVYLDDVVNNTTTLLTIQDYTLIPDTNLDGTGRFYLRLQDTSLSLMSDNLNTIKIYANTKARSLIFSGQLNNETFAKLYNIQGSLILQTTLNINKSVNTINVSNLESGVYIAVLESDGINRMVKKVILN